MDHLPPKLAYLKSFNAGYIEELAKQYQKDPQSVDASWRYFFDGIEFKPDLKTAPSMHSNLEFELKVLELIQAYRDLGYLIADVNPLDRKARTHPLLKMERFGLEKKDLEKTTKVGEILGLGKAAPLKEIIGMLKTYYTSPIAIEYGHIQDSKARGWIQKRVESQLFNQKFSRGEKIKIFEGLYKTEIFEKFLHRRFTGHKRFSVEGCDVVIPMMEFIIENAADKGADEIIIGMAHRGRLNVLANIFRKELDLMLAEFFGNLDTNVGDGDVKYHMGDSENITTDKGHSLHLSLLPNPSHLEAVNPVLMGVARAKQRIKKDNSGKKTLAVMIHGDASFAGQGVVYELLNLSQLKGYSVGGAVHIILNNQIGYTTNPTEARSSPHATDIAKMLEIPAIRVNADEPEAVISATMLALEYRYLFKRDVVIDVVGYRRYGHNEGDEPSFTQPLMYDNIQNHPRVLKSYTQKIVQEGVLSEKDVEKHTSNFERKLDTALNEAKQKHYWGQMSSFGDRWKDMEKPSFDTIFDAVDTSYPRKKLIEIGQQLLTVPDHFNLHPKLARSLKAKQDMLSGKKDIDWSLAEALCYGSLIMEGHRVRVAGQDSIRGTFSHRHASFYDVKEPQLKYTPLNHLEGRRENIEILNSPLSEFAALGFELGQSWAAPKQLTVWEAQFGDFVNGAQIIIDQFITSAAIKWQRYSGLVLLLPHGYEGQGPEHSSARPERFLQSAAKLNIQVCNLTTPAQLFHALRRQIMRKFRIPLIILSPKSLLRHPKVVSPLEDFEKGYFHEIFDDHQKEKIQNHAERIVFCTGKIYYDILAQLPENPAERDFALVRVEQIYPFNRERVLELINSYKKATKVIWAQEEPQNMGAWNFMNRAFTQILTKHKLAYIGREVQASPAGAFQHVHKAEQGQIVNSIINP